MPLSELKTDRILRKKEILENVGISAPTLWRWVQAGIFPKPISMGGGLPGWLESEYRQWLAHRVAER